MKQVTDTSKAILWWNGLNDHDKMIAISKDLKCGLWQAVKMWNDCQGEITDEKINEIYLSSHPLSEHPQPTDTGNTVSSEVGFTGGEWNMYISEKGKDGCSRAYINSALPNDMYETICTMAGLNGTEPGEQAKANAQRIVQAVNNHDKLVSALTELIEVFKGAWATDKDKETYYKAIELLNNISNK